MGSLVHKVIVLFIAASCSGCCIWWYGADENLQSAHPKVYGGTRIDLGIIYSHFQPRAVCTEWPTGLGFIGDLPSTVIVDTLTLGKVLERQREAAESTSEVDDEADIPKSPSSIDSCPAEVVQITGKSHRLEKSKKSSNDTKAPTGSRAEE